MENRILELGTVIFRSLGQERPSVFSSNSLMPGLMLWAMKKPAFKVNLFRLVDVLPQLRSNSEIARHVYEYLSESSSELGGLLGWGLAGKPKSLRARLGSLFVRRGVTEMARMFIAGENPQAAIPKLIALRKRKMAFTVDLLGEYCVSEKEAGIYLERYLEAIRVFAEKQKELSSIALLDGHPLDISPVNISVKLTALYSQCSPLNLSGSVDILSERLSLIAREAAKLKAGIYVDAEDSANNPMIFAAFKKVFGSAEFRDFSCPGAVVQAYAKNSLEILEDLRNFAAWRGSPLALRLVKGAYWDHETALSRQMGWESPLWSKKQESDIQYEKLSRYLLDNRQFFIPAFASHNIRSLSHAVIYAESRGLTEKDFELQMLYGMAEPIARAFSNKGYLTRLYVPLGNMIVGMGYFVRRLLENTSNESFLKHTFYDSGKVAELLRDPVSL